LTTVRIEQIHDDDIEWCRYLRSKQMIRYVFWLVFATVAVSSAGYAQESRSTGHKGTAEQQRACRSDALRLCHGVHEDEAIYQCLRDHSAKLRTACREVIEGGR